MDFGELIDEIMDTPESQYEYKVVIPVDNEKTSETDYYNIVGLKYDHTEKRVIIEW